MGMRTSGSEQEPECTWCETAVAPQNWHPMTTDYSAGEGRIRPFCRQECRDDWIEHTDPDTQPPERGPTAMPPGAGQL